MRCRRGALLVALWLAGGRAAHGQPRVTAAPAPEDRARLLPVLSSLVGSLSTQTRDKMVDLLESVELFDAETEIDRLVGNPWELHDSTAYKLRLLPLHISYPLYSQLGAQMTRLDEHRGERIQNVGPDAVDNLAVRFDDVVDDRLPQDFAGSLVSHFSPREIVDLGVFAMAQQPFFPQTDDEWQHRKHQIARGKYALAAGGLAVGAVFNAGAFAESGPIIRSADRQLALGWYGGVRRLGVALHPQLRGGLTAKMPGLELAAGASERLGPSDTDRRRWLEVAVREGWLDRLTRPAGWDAFLEVALRRVLAAEVHYTGEQTTGRAGLFMRRPGPLRLQHVVFRSSAEIESNLIDATRFVAGVGFEHTGTGLATVLQSSRTAISVDGLRTPETRTGLFVAGTVEPPTQFVVDAMHAHARLAREEWEAILSAAGDGEAERHTARLAGHLADYLQSRRAAYNLLRWPRAPGDLHGPLDAQVVMRGRDLVVSRLNALAALLEGSALLIDSMHARLGDARARVDRLTAEHADRARLDAERGEVARLDQAWRRESDRAAAALQAYQHYRDSLQRMAAASERIVAVRGLDPLSPRTARKLAAMAALSFF